MFSGLTRLEARTVLFVLIATGAGVILGRQLVPPPPAPVIITGNHQVLPAGRLSLEEPQNADSTARTPGTPGAAVTPTRTGAPAPTALTATGLLDVNRATAKDLEILPGIGPTRAAEIVATRERLGGFRRVEDLDAVSGIGAKTLERLRPFVTVGDVTTPPTGPSAPRRIAAAPDAAASLAPVRINTGDARELMRLSGVGEVLAQRIIADRAARGPFRTPEDLTRVRGIGPAILQKNRERISLE